MLLKLGFQKPFPNPCLHFIEQFMRSLLIHLVKNFPLLLRAINQSLFDGIWRFLTSSHCPETFPFLGSVAALAVLWASKSQKKRDLPAPHPFLLTFTALLSNLSTIFGRKDLRREEVTARIPRDVGMRQIPAALTSKPPSWEGRGENK